MPKPLIIGGGIGWCIRRLRASCALVSRKDNQGGEVGFLRDGGVRAMIAIDIDAKYKVRPVRFYGDISSTLMSMANPKSGAVNTDWIIEVYSL